MSFSKSATEIQIEGYIFSPTIRPPATYKAFFLAGAGVRGLDIQGKFVKFTAIGVYLADNAVWLLGGKRKGKATEELMESVEFFMDIITGKYVFRLK